MYRVRMEDIHFYIHLFFSFLVIVSVETNNVSVITEVGEFIGFQKNVDVDGTNVNISKFLGIPYAEPPIGNLRFEKPVAKAVLTKPLVVHEHGSECIQVNLLNVKRPTSEDCLFLNIYAPEKRPGDSDLAVMIYIHGGSYILGSSNAFVSDMLAARGGVIVVTINYRLSVLGFLNIGGPSNFGLWDQHLAIKWVHSNIRAFGGDSARVTIFGESAGAVSVMFQGIYPGNKGLFQRIIAQSGTPSARWGEAFQPLAEAREFASLVSCNQKSIMTMLKCLRDIPAGLINETLNDLSNGLFRYPVPFVPSPDNEFIPVSSKIVLNKDKYDDRAREPRAMLAGVDLMMGVNSGEGASLLSPDFGVYGDIEYFLPNRSYFEDPIVPLCAQSEYGNDVSSAVFESLISVYTAWDDPDNPTVIRENIVDMHGDIQFLAPMVQTIEMYTDVSTKNPYMYYFTATPSTHAMATPSWLDRPNHAEELLYVFGEVNVLSDIAVIGEFKDWERNLSNTIMTMWANFAKSGNPNAPGVDWHPYTPTNRRYLEIGKYLNQTVTKERLFEQRTHLWNKLLPVINEQTSYEQCDTTTSGGINISGVTTFGLGLAVAVSMKLF